MLQMPFQNNLRTFGICGLSLNKESPTKDPTNFLNSAQHQLRLHCQLALADLQLELGEMQEAASSRCPKVVGTALLQQ